MSIKISTWTGANPPIARLRQKMQRRLQPTNEIEDPYIAAVLIALARQRRRPQNPCIEEEVTAGTQATEASQEAVTYFKV